MRSLGRSSLMPQRALVVAACSVGLVLSGCQNEVSNPTAARSSGPNPDPNAINDPQVLYVATTQQECTGYWDKLTRVICRGWASGHGLRPPIYPGYKLCKIHTQIMSQSPDWNIIWRQKFENGRGYFFDSYIRACPPGSVIDRKRGWLKVRFHVYIIGASEQNKNCDYKIEYKPHGLLCQPQAGGAPPP
jgi:hypothetical protein